MSPNAAAALGFFVPSSPFFFGFAKKERVDDLLISEIFLILIKWLDMNTFQFFKNLMIS